MNRAILDIGIKRSSSRKEGNSIQFFFIIFLNIMSDSNIILVWSLKSNFTSYIL